MTARPRFIGTLAACGVLLASVALVSFATPVTPNSACEELRAWAEMYEGTSPSLDELAHMDRAHRRAVFSAVSSDVRASLFREHLRRFDAQADLSAAQRALIREAMTLVTPELYERQPAALEALGEFRRRAEPAFVEHTRVWFDLTTVSDAPAMPRALFQAPPCDCNGAQQDCWFGRPCMGSACTYGWGCGYALVYECNGLCQ